MFDGATWIGRAMDRVLCRLQGNVDRGYVDWGVSPCMRERWPCAMCRLAKGSAGGMIC